MQPSNTNLTRRGALRAAMAAGAVALAPETVNAGKTVPDTPILRLFHERCVLRDHLNSTATNYTEAEFDLLWAKMIDLEGEIMRIPVSCTADLAAKMITDTCEGEGLSSWKTGELWVEARALTGTGI